MRSTKIAILLVAMLWGSSFAFQKHLLEVINPVVFTLYNFLVTGVFFLIFALIKKQNIFYRLREGVGLALLIVAMELTQMFGLHLSTAANTSFISNLGMLTIPYLGWLFFRHKVTSLNSFVLLLAIGGMYFLVGGVAGFGFGDLILLISAIAMGLYFLFSERFEGERGGHMLTLCAQQFTIAGLVCLPIAHMAQLPLTIPESVRIEFGWLILIFTILPYTLIQWASRHSNEMMLAVYDGVVEPLVGGIVAWGLFLEATTMTQVLGGLTMVFAFAISVIYNRSHPLLR